MFGNPSKPANLQDLSWEPHLYALETKFSYSKTNKEIAVNGVPLTNPVIVPGPEGVGNGNINLGDDSPNLNPQNTWNPPVNPSKFVPSVVIDDDSPNLNPQNTWNPPTKDEKNNAKIDAFNDKSGKPMPTQVPANAVENSSALSPVNPAEPIYQEPGPTNEPDDPINLRPIDDTKKVNPPILHSPPTIAPND